jgi:hypothetical protein
MNKIQKDRIAVYYKRSAPLWTIQSIVNAASSIDRQIYMHTTISKLTMLLFIKGLNV